MPQLEPFIDAVRHILKTHEMGTPGQYRRWLAGDDREEAGPNPYGCADAANILYTIGDLPKDPTQKATWINSLQDLQDPETGFFIEATHHKIHTTAHCIAALELFDAKAKHPIHALHDIKDHNKLAAFLDQLKWKDSPWNASHQGAGCFAALVLNEEVDEAWQQAYFNWITSEFDPETGFVRKGHVAEINHRNRISMFPHLAGSFHYLFNMQYRRVALPYPEAMIDTSLWMWNEQKWPLGKAVGFAEIDWVYCITRAREQSGHRFDDCQKALLDFTDIFLDHLLNLDPQTHVGLNDLHSLFGTLCCLAELQRTLPNRIHTHKPLHLVLDRRPFI